MDPPGELLGLLIRKGKTLAMAESCTGGFISHMITMVPGASQVFYGGVVSNANHLKVELLGVSEEHLKSFGAVSREVAEEMAVGVRRLTGADIGVGVTGIAGPGGGTAEKPVGLVYLGFDLEGEVDVLKKQYTGLTRGEFKERVAEEVFTYLKERVKGDD